MLFICRCTRNNNGGVERAGYGGVKNLLCQLPGKRDFYDDIDVRELLVNSLTSVKKNVLGQDSPGSENNLRCLI